jgi:protocatechuate 3,4-dioxygenase beta subunit
MQQKRTTTSETSGRRRSAIVTRRQALGLLGAAGAAWTAACTSSPGTPSSTTPPTTTTPGTSAQCAVTPTETAGPFPSRADFIRSDIREDRRGLPVTLTITVVNVNAACAPVPAAEVEIWQCDVDGSYSQYGSSSAATFLRGIQTTDASGRVTFTTIYPGWYQGRATHIHVEVTMGGRSVKVTQIAFPENVTADVYRTGVYAARGQNPTTNQLDNVFSDGVDLELASLSGDTTNGYTATFQVGIAV